jgi:hypothetical protein
MAGMRGSLQLHDRTPPGPRRLDGADDDFAIDE